MGKETMTPRERVLRALEHREPDRVPISMTITIDAYNNLKKYMGIEIDEKPKVGRWTDVDIHPLVAEKYGLDVVRLGDPIAKGPKVQPTHPKALFADEWHCEWSRIDRPGGGYYYEMVKHPLAEATKVSDLDGFPWPEPGDVLPETVEYFHKVRETTDLAIMTKTAEAVFELATYLNGHQKWYTDLAIRPEYCYAVMEHIAEVQAARDVVALKKIGKYVDVLRLSGEDMGTQEGPLISLKMFRQLVRPHLEKVWTAAKTALTAGNPRGKIMLHSCGAVRVFMKDWADMGLDVLDPIQTTAKGMDTALIKQEVGDRLSFHGAIDIQWLLPHGTPEQVRQDVRKRIKDLGPGGGFIVSPTHNVQGDVPPENLIAMRDAVWEFGYYPLDL
jgi:uroporphyrinogen decarboxylase